MFFGLEVEGLDEAVSKYQALHGGISAELPDDVQQAGLPIYYALATYPDPIPSSNYQRTYFYRDSLETEVVQAGDEVAFIAYQNAPYSIYLRGTEDGSYSGAWMHLGRWRTLKDIIDTLLPVVVSKIQDSIDRLIDRVWGWQ